MRYYYFVDIFCVYSYCTILVLLSLKRKVDQYYLWLHLSKGLISEPFLSCFKIYLNSNHIIPLGDCSGFLARGASPPCCDNRPICM